MARQHLDPPDDGSFRALLRLALEDTAGRCRDIAHWFPVDEPDWDDWTRHLARCESCRRTLRDAVGTDSGYEKPDHWDALQQRAMDLFPPESEGVIRLVVKAVEDAFSLVSGFGERLEPWTVRSHSDATIAVSGHLGPHIITAHLNPEAGGKVGVVFDIGTGGDAAHDITRVSLCHGQRELDSCVPRGGRVWFSSLNVGSYRILFFSEFGPGRALDLRVETDQR